MEPLVNVTEGFYGALFFLSGWAGDNTSRRKRWRQAAMLHHQRQYILSSAGREGDTPAAAVLIHVNMKVDQLTEMGRCTKLFSKCDHGYLSS